MTTTFNELLREEGVSRTWLLELSTDDFATVSYRWATNACHYNGFQYQGRLAKLGRITKAFGLDNLPVASNFTVAVDNADRAADFLCDVSGGPVELTYRFRLSLGLFDPKAAQTLDVEPTARVMGFFGLYNSPSRNANTVQLQLADDSMGRFSELASSPTINEWIQDAGTTGDTCLLFGQNPTPVIDFNIPTPLAWGPFTEAQVVAVQLTGGSIPQQGAPGSLASAGLDASTGFSHTIIVCATTSADDVTANDVTDVSITYKSDAMLGAQKWSQAGSTWSVPKTYTIPKGNPQGVADGTYNNWEALKSDVIVKDGHNWRILWIAVNASNFQIWAALTYGQQLGGPQPDGGTTAFALIAPTAVGENVRDWNASIAAIATWTISGFPLSAQTNKTGPYQNGLNVALDLLSFYSQGDASDVDTTTFANAAKTNDVLVQGTLQPLQLTGQAQKFLPAATAAVAPGSLRQALGDIGQSIAVDFYFTWAGKLAVAAGWFDFNSITNTPLDISEVRALNIKDRKPSVGERWSYFNRIYVVGQDGVKRGPYDNTAAIAAVGATVSKILQAKWLETDVATRFLASAATLWQLTPRLEAKQRSLLSFTSLKEILQIDLAGLFTFTWTRGNTGAVYDGSVFRVESLVINPTDLSVDTEGVWVDDIATINPYLLDTESFTLRVAASGGRTATVTDASDIVDFSSGDLVADGVLAGDILLLLDGTLAANVFSRYRALRILAVSGAGDELQVVDADLDFDAPSGVAVGTWAIYRGATTYPNFSSDPTDYPSGSAMYGKVTNAAGVFSDSSPGNQLLEG